jgi:hypothetical protein
MSLRLRTRLQTLERGVVTAHDCPVCRQRRDRIALVDIRQHQDDSVTYADNVPPVCVACGQIPELVVEVVVAVVDCPAVAPDGAGPVSMQPPPLSSIPQCRH